MMVSNYWKKISSILQSSIKHSLCRGSYTRSRKQRQGRLKYRNESEEVTHDPNNKCRAILVLFLVIIVAVLLFYIAIIIWREVKPPKITLEPYVQLSTVGDGPITQGALSVIVTSDRDVNIGITVLAEDGVLFNTQSGYRIENAFRQATVPSLALRVNESRTLRFTYRIDPDTELSGKYLFIIKAFDTKDGNSYKFLSKTKSAVFIDTSGENVRFLPSPESFYNFLIPEHRVLTESGYWAGVYLLDEERPRGGLLTLLVRSPKSNYDPEVTVTVSDNGGILFLETRHVSIDNSGFMASTRPGTIELGGSRLVLFPFQLNPRSLDGDYVIEVSSHWKKLKTVDRVPFLIRVNSSTLGHGERWLSIHAIEPD